MTERIYYTDSYVQEFSARVVRVLPAERDSVILDRTCFYPASGGQPCDTGTLGNARVVDVFDELGEIVHVLSGLTPSEGEQLVGRIDWDRRFDHMQQHTGQHILSQACLQALGAATVSFHLGAAVSTLELELGALQQDQMELAENLANRIVFEDRRVSCLLSSPDGEAAQGLRKPSMREGTLRVVEIEGFDRSACGGTHCSRTGQVGLIRARRWERIRQNVRLEFVCGARALRDYRMAQRTVFDLARQFSVGDESVGEAVERLRENERNARKEVEQLREERLAVLADRTAESAGGSLSPNLVTAIWDSLDGKELHFLATRLLEDRPSRLVLLGSRGPTGLLLFARGPEAPADMRRLLNVACEVCGGRGGGSADRSQAGGCRSEQLEEAIQAARSLILDQ